VFMPEKKFYTLELDPGEDIRYRFLDEGRKE
jgi:hypothetical protein